MQDTDIHDLVAAAHALVDLTQAGAEGLSSTSIAALNAIRTHESLSIGDIAGIVGLTHSATVRLIDRLEKDWLVRRGRRKGREVMVETTARGNRRIAALNDSLNDTIREVLERMPKRDREGLTAGATNFMRALVDMGQDQKRLYRFGGGPTES